MLGRLVVSPDVDEPFLEEFIAAWDDLDPEAISSLFVEGGTYLDPYLKEEATGEEIRAYVEEIGEVFPDFRFDWHRTLTTSEGVAAVEWTIYGTHTGAFGSIPPTGNTVSVPGVSIISFSDEGITAQRDYWDRRTLIEQLGLTFPTVITQLPTLAWGALRERP